MDRAARLLRAAADAGRAGESTVRLGETCGINRATAWRILSTLEVYGLVANDRESGLWTVGAAVVEIARASGQELALQHAHDLLERLALETGETAALALPTRDGLRYVDEVLPNAAVAVTWLHGGISLHATSTGKAQLAWAPPEEIERVLAAGLEQFTPETVTDPDQLRAELAETRERGYATCRGEFDPSAWGVSAPVLNSAGRPVAVVSIWGPPPRVNVERFARLGAMTRRVADEMRAV